MKKFLAAAVLVLAAAAAAQKAPSSEPPVLTIGTTISSLSQEEADALTKMALYLSGRLPQYRFIVRDYSVAHLEEAVRAGELDFFLATSGFYRRVYHRGLRDLVTVTTPQAPDPNYGSGSLFMVRQDSPVRSIADMRGRRLAISWPEGFTGHFIPLGEIVAQGFDPDTFFSKEITAGPGSQNILASLLEGKADIAAIRACRYEEIARKDPGFAAQFRPVGAKTDPAECLHCLHSTALYPNWTIVSSSKAPWQASRDVTEALLSMPAGPDGSRWAVVSDFASVDELYKTLRRGPFEYLRHRPMRWYAERYWPIPALFLAILAILVWNNRRVSRLVDERTQLLRESVAHEIAAQQKAQESARRLQSLERVSVVGAMSSLIAHELNGPLAGISNATRSLERFFENNPQGPAVSRALLLIGSQCDKASRIVQKVRGYAKQKENALQRIDAAACAQRVFDLTRQVHPEVRFSAAFPSGPLMVLWDDMELELAISNLLKNAMEAAVSQPAEEPHVHLSLAQAGSSVVVEVTNNTAAGAASADAGTPLKSTKASGLGLGLLIVRTLVEKVGGRATLTIEGGRAAAVLTLPLADHE